jgi:hypothetical protein
MDGSFYPNWPVVFDTLLFGMPSVLLDIDHDGNTELFCDGARRSSEPPYYLYSLVFLIDDDGSVMPGFPLRHSRPHALSAGDMNGDNEYELFFLSRDELSIYSIDKHGNAVSGWPVPLPYDLQENAGAPLGPAIGDLDLDGNNEFMVLGDYNIYAYNFDGSMHAGFPIAIWDQSFAYRCPYMGALADLDADGYLEITVPGSNWIDTMPPNLISFIAVYEHTGQMKIGFPLFRNRYISTPPIPVDIDGNGSLELGFYDDSLNFVDLAGNQMPGWPIYPNGADDIYGVITSELVVVDIDADGDQELFSDLSLVQVDSPGFITRYLTAHSHTGQTLPGFPMRVDGYLSGRPPTFATDAGGPGLLMAVSMSKFDSIILMLYRFPDSAGALDEWPMLGHDNLLTRNRNFVDRVTGVGDHDAEVLPRNFILGQNYPNPFNATTAFEYVLPQDAFVTLSLFDICGRKILDLKNGIIAAGSHRQKLTLNDCPSGIYFYRLKAGDVEITRKMALVK